MNFHRSVQLPFFLRRHWSQNKKSANVWQCWNSFQMPGVELFRFGFAMLTYFAESRVRFLHWIGRHRTRTSGRGTAPDCRCVKNNWLTSGPRGEAQRCAHLPWPPRCRKPGIPRSCSSWLWSRIWAKGWRTAEQRYPPAQQRRLKTAHNSSDNNWWITESAQKQHVMEYHTQVSLRSIRAYSKDGLTFLIKQVNSIGTTT